MPRASARCGPVHTRTTPPRAVCLTLQALRQTLQQAHTARILFTHLQNDEHLNEAGLVPAMAVVKLRLALPALGESLHVEDQDLRCRIYIWHPSATCAMLRCGF